MTSGEVAGVPLREDAEPCLFVRSVGTVSYRAFEAGEVRIIWVKTEICGVEAMGFSRRVSRDTGSDTSSMASSFGLLPS